MVKSYFLTGSVSPVDEDSSTVKLSHSISSIIYPSAGIYYPSCKITISPVKIFDWFKSWTYPFLNTDTILLS